jgi:hypothetical protein
MKTIFFALLWFVCLGDRAFSQSEPPPGQIRVEMLVVRLPEAKAVELQPELIDPQRAKAARDKLLAMIKGKEAELVDWPVLWARSGDRVVSENIRELRYPTSHDELLRAPAKPANPAPEFVEKPGAPPAGARKDGAGAGQPAEPGPRIIGGAPTHFETRNVGVTLEMEATISEDKKSVQGQVAPQHVIFQGFRQEKVEVVDKFTMVVSVPEFHTVKTSSNFKVPSGQPHLLGFFRVPKPEGTVELFLATFTIVETEK